MVPAFIGNEIKGSQRILIVYEDKVVLKQVKNFSSVITHNFFKGDKTISYSQMTGVQFKKASNFILGYIQFETSSTRGGDNFNSENSWTFDTPYNDVATKIVDYVNERISQQTSGQIIQQVSSADELLKYKQLLDSGIITQEEFDKKKKDLLGL